MARKNAPTISQEELYPQSDEPTRQDLDDARLFDLDAEQESPFLRGQKRVSVRRSSLPKKTVTRLTWTLIVLVVMFLGSVAVAAVYHYGERSWRFRVDSSDHIEITGLENVTRSQVMEVIGGDIGRNIFFVPMAQRKKQLEQIRQCNEICSQPSEDRNPRTHSRGLRPCRFQDSSGRRRGHSHGIAQQEEVFVPGNSGNELR